MKWKFFFEEFLNFQTAKCEKQNNNVSIDSRNMIKLNENGSDVASENVYSQI